MQPDAKGTRRSGSGPFPTAGYADWIDRCSPEEGVQYAVSAVDRLPHSSTFFLGGLMPAGDTTLQRLLDDACLGERQVYDQLLMRACERLGFLAKTAQVLGCSLRTVKRRWQEARILLQQAIESGESQ